MTLPDNIILLLHSDSHERDAFNELLRDSCTLITVDTGEEGLSLAHQHSPSLVILDQELKGMNIHSFLEQLSTFPREDYPVIVLAAECSREEMRRYYQSGVSVLLRKPVNAPELSELARSLMIRFNHAQEESLQLKHCQELIKTYASSVHTMKNYINTVGSFIENIKWSKTDAETMKELLEDKNLAQVVNILKDLADLSRVILQDSSPDQWQSDRIDICKIIANKLIFFKFGKKNSKIKVEALLPEAGDVFVKGNRFLFSSTLENILSNARDEVLIQRGAWSEKYLEVDSGKVMAGTDDPDIIISVQKERDAVMIRISNVGRTISDDDKQRIFERGITFKAGGTGIGLYDSRNIVRDMGGTIHVEDFDAKGACFCINLPAMVESPGASSEDGIQK